MAITARVSIDGLISAENWQGSLQSVSEQLSWQGEYDDIQLTINSFGGDCTEGLAIYDFLRAKGKPITTIAIGSCCSVASVIFCAGSSRLIHENTTFMVHQASGECWGNAADLRVYADWVDTFNKQIAKIYEATTGKNAEIVAGWIGATDTFMTADETVLSGFATAIVRPIQARAFISKPANTVNQTNQSTMKIITDNVARLIKAVQNRMELKPVKNEAVKLADGSTIDVETSGEMAEGDAVTIGGMPAPDGTYTLDSGAKIVVVDGVIESIDTAGVANSGESIAVQDASTQPAPTAETVTVPKSEYDDLKAKAKLAEQLPSIQANLSRLTKIVGSRESGDVQTNANRTPSNVSVTPTTEAPKTAVERHREAKEKAKAEAK